MVQLLARLPVQWALLQESGLPQTVRERTLTHSSKSTRDVSGRLIQHWIDANTETSADPAAVAAAAADHAAVANGSRAPLNGSVKREANGVSKAPARQADLQAFMDPDDVARIAQLEAEYQQVSRGLSVWKQSTCSKGCVQVKQLQLSW